MDRRLDRANGAFLGLAVGDALGTTLEFAKRDSRPLHTEMTGGGPFALAAGQWTDDTSMTLCLADGLIRRWSFDAKDLMGRFVNWYRFGENSCTGACFDIGVTTAAALDRFEATGECFAGSTREDHAGNGSLMRLAPVALFALADGDLADGIARDQSRTTHGAPQAVEACAYFVQVLRAAILGENDVLRARTWNGHPAIAAIAAGAWRAKDRGSIRSSGYVVDTLEAAIWCAARSQSFEEALILAVNLGEDADTVGAVTGQLAGTLHGLSAIPARWLGTLALAIRAGGARRPLTFRAPVTSRPCARSLPARDARGRWPCERRIKATPSKS